MALALHSCIDEPEVPALALDESSQLAQVRDWFEANKTKLRLPERGTNFRTESQELILPFFEKEPDWEQFHHYYFPDGREVYEISLENATKYFPTSMLDSFPDRNVEDLVIQNIMFISHPTEQRFDPVIARYYPNGEGSIEDFENISYNSIPPLWSGSLEVFTYDERFFVGFKFLEGILDHSYQYEPYVGDKKLDYSKYDMTCSTAYFPVGYRVCAGSSCRTVIERYVAATSCSGSSLTSFSYTGFGGGGTPSGGPDGGGCSSCYNVPKVPKPKLSVKNELKNQPCASGVFEDLKKMGLLVNNNTQNEIAKSISSFTKEIFEDASKHNYFIRNSDEINEAKVHINRKTGGLEFIVNLNNSYLNSATKLSIARTIIHETVHSFINYKLYSDLDYSIEFQIKYQKYLEKNGITRAQHELMGEYVTMMAYNLKEWDRRYGAGQANLLDDEYYYAMAFGGLYKNKNNSPTDSFKKLVPSGSDRLKIRDIILNEQNGTNSKGKKCEE